MRLNFLLLPVALAALVGCGPVSLEGAIDQAASSACAKFDDCGEIGKGGSYASQNACLNDWRSTFQDLWPASKCEDNLNPDGYDQCLQRINIMQCGNLLDLANIGLNCTSSTVCGGNI